jgi:hypothetical protein
MTWKIALTAVAAALVSLSAAAPAAVAKSPLEGAERPAKRQCFWTHQINGFAASDDRFVNVRVGVKDVYQFEMLGRCPDVDWSTRIAVVSRGSSRICDGLDAEVIAPSPIGPMRCPVRTVRKLSPTEVAALKGRGRP